MKLFIGDSQEIYEQLKEFQVISFNAKEKHLFERVLSLSKVKSITKEKLFLINDAHKMSRTVQIKFAESAVNIALETVYPEKINYKLKDKCQIIKIEPLVKVTIQQAVLSVLKNDDRRESLKMVSKFRPDLILTYLSENLARSVRDPEILNYNFTVLKNCANLLYKTHSDYILSYLVFAWRTIPRVRSIKFPEIWHKKAKKKKPAKKEYKPKEEKEKPKEVKTKSIFEL